MSKIINYTNKEFETIKKALIEYAKQYYPNTFKDFSKASFGAMMIDLVSLLGDQLNFQLDYQANEQFLYTAQQYDNIEKLAREKGYKNTGRFANYADLDIYIIVPADSNGRPNSDYIPILQKNSTMAVRGSNALYSLIDDVDFNLQTTEIVVSTVDANGLPTFFAMKTKGKAISGNLYSQEAIITSFENFLKIRIDNPFMTEIISVTDSSGNEYYQVDFLSQNCVFKAIKNVENTASATKYKLTKIYTNRRFIVEEMDGFYYLIFGNGSIDRVSDPRNVIMNFRSRDYISEDRIDSLNIIESDKFGIAPVDTTLTIIYRANNIANMSAAAGTLTKVLNPRFRFNTLNLNSATANAVISSIQVENPEPIASVNSTLNASELKRRAIDSYSAQYRAVSKDDYVHMCYRLDPKYGAIKRATVLQDTNSFKRNLNLYVIGEDNDGNLAYCNDITKQNLKNWIENYKMINDTIDIKNPIIINFGIECTVDSSYEHKEIVAIKCITKLKEHFFDKFDIGEHLSISKVYKILNVLPEVIDVKKVKMILKNESGYSQSNYDLYGNISADGSYIICPENAIFELKYLEDDIKLTVI